MNSEHYKNSPEKNQTRASVQKIIRFENQQKLSLLGLLGLNIIIKRKQMARSGAISSSLRSLVTHSRPCAAIASARPASARCSCCHPRIFSRSNSMSVDILPRNDTAVHASLFGESPWKRRLSLHNSRASSVAPTGVSKGLLPPEFSLAKHGLRTLTQMVFCLKQLIIDWFSSNALPFSGKNKPH